MSKRELLIMEILKKIYPYLNIKGLGYNLSTFDCDKLSFQYNGKNGNDLKIPTMDIFKYNEGKECYDDDKDMMTVSDIEGIIDKNSYESLIDPNDIDLMEQQYKYGQNNNNMDDKMYMGLWLLTSYINHNDSPNSYRMIWYNTMIIMADRDIKKDEEITNSYLNPFMEEDDKKDILSEKWGIQ